MKRSGLILIALLAALLFAGCKDHAVNKLKRQMKPLAEAYLKTEHITNYDSLTIDRVDTITEMDYAQFGLFYLIEMETDNLNQYEIAIQEGNRQRMDSLAINLNKISTSKADFEDLIENGELKEDEILLFMVSGHYRKDNNPETVFFFVTADKRNLYTLDPFDDNLLYKD